MSAVVVDSNFLVALLDERDTWHSRANEVALALPPKASRLFFDTVVAESVSVIARRCEEQNRVDAFVGIIASLRKALPRSRILSVSSLTQSYYDNILDLMISYSGSLNFNDCLIALFMKKNGLTYLASFDADFDSLSYIKRISSPTTAVEVFR
jgi:predicted nucleic acid-binding protein